MKKLLNYVGIGLFIMGCLSLLLTEAYNMINNPTMVESIYGKVEAITNMLLGVSFFIFAKFGFKDEIEDQKLKKCESVILSHIQDLKNMQKQFEEYELDGVKVFLKTSEEIKLSISELEAISKG